MEGVKRNITVLFESELSKLEHHLESTITTLVCNMSKEDQPSSNSRHHKTIPPKRGSPQEEFDDDLSPNTTTFRSKIRRKNPTARGFLFLNLPKITRIHFFFVNVATSVGEATNILITVA